MKKLLFIACFALLTGASQAQFSKFKDGCSNCYDAYKVSEVLASSDESSMCIYIEVEGITQWSELKQATGFENLECLNIKFNLDPESSDAEKAEFIKKIKIVLSDFEIMFKSPKLTQVVFTIGEQVFLTKEEVEKSGGKYKKMASLNLKNAWTSIGSDVQTVNPMLRISAENWNW